MALTLHYGRKEVRMIHIKVQYDGRQRAFKLVDEKFKTLLEGDAIYDLQVPFIFDDEYSDGEQLSWVSATMAHA